MYHVTKYCNVIVPHCTVQQDTACIPSSPDLSLLLWMWGGLMRLDSRPANLATPKTLRLGCLVGRAPVELLASHTHCRKIDNSE